jgi:hypothetical protein
MGAVEAGVGAHAVDESFAPAEGTTHNIAVDFIDAVGVGVADVDDAGVVDGEAHGGVEAVGEVDGDAVVVDLSPRRVAHEHVDVVVDLAKEAVAPQEQARARREARLREARHLRGEQAVGGRKDPAHHPLPHAVDHRRDAVEPCVTDKGHVGVVERHARGLREACFGEGRP